MASLTHPIDVGILVVFLVVNIVVGLRYGRSVKTLRDYALGGKNFSTSILVATIVATWVSGSGLFINLEKTYKQGLYYVIPDIIGTPMCLLITGHVVGPRMGKFLNDVSVPELSRSGSCTAKLCRLLLASLPC